VLRAVTRIVFLVVPVVGLEAPREIMETVGHVGGVGYVHAYDAGAAFAFADSGAGGSWL